MNILLKRAYEPYSPDDGYRVLVDRLWPRGVTKAAAHIDEWAKDLAPTTELRQWFGHDPARWAEFQKKYLKELASNPAVSRLRGHAKMTLVYGARDTEHNDAAVLKKFLTD
jgi:uncharacterized protein YeaO (DUF488 family)